MNSETMITELYRQIGRSFREHGADRVVLLKAKTIPSTEQNRTNLSAVDNKAGEGGQVRPNMYLEIAADGCFMLQELQKLCAAQWPDVEISILDLNAEENLELIDEVLEDGILL